MSGLTFSSDAAETLIAAYKTPDMVRQREATLHRLNLKLGERVIDIGCGPGFLCESMAAAVSATGRVVGIDISKDLIDSQPSTKVANPSNIAWETRQRCPSDGCNSMWR